MKFMVNRVLIRLKVVQTVYSYSQNGAGNQSAAARELSLSLSSSHELYFNLLNILAELGRFAKLSVSRKERFSPDTLHNSERRFAGNALLAQLMDNGSLQRNMDAYDTEWIAESGIIKSLYESVMDSEALSDYVQNGDYGYEADKELVRRMYKTVICGNDVLDEALENQNIYWSSDRELADSFVLKTLKGFSRENGAEQTLPGQFGDPDDASFAEALLKASLENESEYRGMIALHTKGWDASRLAMMDVIVMQVALAEILCIPDIPVKVSINEYVELAKMFGTSGSGGFVNGVLDTLVRELRDNGRLTK